jgi:hypothetical protein
MDRRVYARWAVRLASRQKFQGRDLGRDSSIHAPAKGGGAYLGCRRPDNSKNRFGDVGGMRGKGVTLFDG